MAEAINPGEGNSEATKVCADCHPQIEKSKLGFWRQFGQVVRNEVDAKDQHVIIAFLAGMVIPAFYIWKGLQGDSDGMEFFTMLGAFYIALTSLFALLSSRSTSEFSAVMPPLIISSAVSAALLAVATFIIKVDLSGTGG
jgi:hypothetical protein